MSARARIHGNVLVLMRAHAVEHLRPVREKPPLLVRLRLAEDPRYRNIIDLVDEVLRLRGIILSSARTVEGDPSGGMEDLTRYFDRLMAEAAEIRKEIGG